MKKDYLVRILSVCLVVSLIMNWLLIFKYLEQESTDNIRFNHAIDNFYSYGLEMPQYKIEKIMELIHNDTADAQDGIETWLLEIASDYSVADSSSAIVQVNSRNFFGHLKSLLLDMIRTEKDFEKWKQVCLELQEITTYVTANINKDDLKEQSTAEEKWKIVMRELKERYGHTYLIANMMMLG